MYKDLLLKPFIYTVQHTWTETFVQRCMFEFSLSISLNQIYMLQLQVAYVQYGPVNRERVRESEWPLHCELVCITSKIQQTGTEIGAGSIRVEQTDGKS